MLAPRAWKRMRSPAFRQSKPKESNCRDRGRSSVWPLISHSALMQSVTEIKDFLNRASVGLETVAIARDGICHSLQKFQSGVHILVAMKGHEAARKKFCNRLAAAEAREQIAAAVLQNENSQQRSSLRQRELGLAMPRGAIHENFIVVSANLMFTNDNAVVAENFYWVKRSPQPRRST